METLKTILLILTVIFSFNMMIFVHELGHFLAARWRGLKVEKFRIWFGKPIWAKTVNGVEYGLGWIPAGGFVSLPQMAPMDSIEGKPESGEELPPVSPLDKIIVAFAGPLFSLGLALVIGLTVWGLGKPQDLVHTTQIGYIHENSPAEKAGFQLGDTILAVNEKPVAGFMGSLDCITENIILSRGQTIRFTVKREGITEPITVQSSFQTEEVPWYKRRAMRKVGLSYANEAIVDSVLENSPAAKAGLQKGDIITAINGNKIWSASQVAQMIDSKPVGTEFIATVKRGEATLELPLKAATPLTPKDAKPMLGLAWNLDAVFDTHIIHPDPIKQCKDSVRMMMATIIALTARDSSVGIDQLSGPISIGMAKYDLLSSDANGWRRLLAFLVLINVNLAIFNLLPFPVLDGGHITLAIMEWIARRPVKVRILEYVQSACALLLMGLFLYITTKDVGDFFGPKEKREPVTFAP
jgi:regulator of sigma E protease